MSLQPQVIPPIPAETARIAHAIFPKKKSLYMLMRDTLGVIYTDALFTDLFPRRGQPALAPWRLALITVMQYIEGLTDRQAADAVRTRIDWKYALSLELADTGFDASVLCEFRGRLVAGNVEHVLFETLLTTLKERGFVKAGGKQRTDSTHVLAAVRVLSRIELAGETLRAALNSLALVAPQWVRQHVAAEWFDRYGRRCDELHLPQSETAWEAYALQIGADGMYLLAALSTNTAPAYVREVEAVDILRRAWIEQYYMDQGHIRWRTMDERPPSHLRLHSPYDPDADFTTKRATVWTGYKVHLTETCDPDTVHLITHVETTRATVPDGARTADIQSALIAADIKPAEHIVDRGYVNADHMLTSAAEQGITLVGPLPVDTSWQAMSGSPFSKEHFRIDWVGQSAECPNGKRSVLWQDGVDAGKNAVVRIKFARADCSPCRNRLDCTRSADTRRALTLRTRDQHERLQAARQRETTPDFKAVYDLRAGIEGTLSQGVRVFGLRRTRYRGIAKTHIAHLATATAMNVVRIVAWLERDEQPVPPRKPTAFARLAAPLA